MTPRVSPDDNSSRTERFLTSLFRIFGLTLAKPDRTGTYIPVITWIVVNVPNIIALMLMLMLILIIGTAIGKVLLHGPLLYF